MKVIKLIVALIWAIVGFIIWIPILFRIMFVYIFNICYLTVVEKNLEEKKHLDLLATTGSIYINGFKNIFKEDDGKIIHPARKNPKRKIWLEILWTIIFWGTVIIPLLLR